MENASKALLIAASVLIVIILIAVGIKIYSSTTEAQKVGIDTGATINDITKTASDLAVLEITREPAQSNPTINTFDQKIEDVITNDNYGDYIDLGKDVLGDLNSENDWRILYNDKAGHVYVILADYLPNSKNPAVTTIGFNTKKTYNIYLPNNSNRDALIAGLNHETAWNSLISSTLIGKGVTVKGAITGEILMASYNEKYGTNLKYIDYPSLGANPNDGSSLIDPLYMPHLSDSEGSYGYWLTSPSTDNPDAVWTVCNNNFVTLCTFYTAYNGVRPVVSLPSDIQITKKGEIWTVVQ